MIRIALIVALLSTSCFGVIGDIDLINFRGDVDSNGTINISDAVAIANFLNGGEGFACPETADFNASGSISSSDSMGILNYLFAAGPGPGSPSSFGPEECGS